MSPAVLLAPDKFHWILGKIAQAIVETNPGFDFAYSTRDEIRSAPPLRNISVPMTPAGVSFRADRTIRSERQVMTPARSDFDCGRLARRPCQTWAVRHSS
jgi:hypothetical protein